jgi:hypothetical protein
MISLFYAGRPLSEADRLVIALKTEVLRWKVSGFEKSLFGSALLRYWGYK